MLKRTFVLAVFCGSFQIATVIAAPVRTMYTEALARERTVRTALTAAAASPAVLSDVHAVVAAYEAVVAKYPASGYCDDALWLAGRLALDAFGKFGDTRDRDAGVRLLKRLATGYPTSKWARQVPEQLANLAQASRAEQAPPQRAAETTKPATLADPRASAAGPTDPPNRSGVATIKAIRRAVLPETVRITIELDAEVPFHEERIVDPARVFVDLPGTRATPALVDQTLRFDSDADIVRQVRIGRHPNNMTRIVLDAAGVTSYSIYPLYSPYRLVIDCVRAQTATTALTVAVRPLDARDTTAAMKLLAKAPTMAPPPPLTPPTPPLLSTTRRLPPEGQRQPPGMSPRATQLIANAMALADAPVIVETTAALSHQSSEGAAIPSRQSGEGRRSAESTKATATAPPTQNTTGGFSIARQLGLGVSRIVIDAGHGGYDPGAKGKGVTEAELVLDVTLRLEKLLQKVPGIEVILTRRTDEFIPLPERTAIANREGADLFLSIHANASPNPQARGIETYFLNFASRRSR